MLFLQGENVKIKNFAAEKYNTKMLFRCTSQLYAERFIETGNLRFGLPKEWIEEYKRNGAGRGDELEGCYASMPNFNLKAAEFYRSQRDNVEIFQRDQNGIRYFRSKDVLDMRTFCLFGLDSKYFTEMKMGENKKLYPSYTLTKKYFEDFGDVNEEEYDHLPPEEKPVVLMIHNPKEFHRRLRNFMREFGVNDNEWIIHPVNYSDKSQHFIVGDDIPAELFSKDISFEYQREIRAVVHTKRYSVIKKFNQCNGIVDIGYMGDIASIQDYYFRDMEMELRGNNKLIYTLPKPIVTALDDLPERTLMCYVQQAYDNCVPGYDFKNVGEIEEYIAPLLEALEKKEVYFDKKQITFKFKNDSQKYRVIVDYE